VQRGAIVDKEAVNVINDVADVVQDLSTNAEIIALKDQIQSLMDKNATVINTGSSVDMTLIQELQKQVATLESELKKVKEAKPINSTVVRQEADADISSTVNGNNPVNKPVATSAPSSSGDSVVGDGAADLSAATGGEDPSGAVGGASGSSNTATTTTSSAFAMKIGYGLIPIAFVQAVHGL